MKYVYIVQKNVSPEYYDVIAVTSTYEKAVKALEAKSGIRNFLFKNVRRNFDLCYPPNDDERVYAIAKTIVDNPYFFVEH